jgi:hypothetical protein
MMRFTLREDPACLARREWAEQVGQIADHYPTTISPPGRRSGRGWSVGGIWRKMKSR